MLLNKILKPFIQVGTLTIIDANDRTHTFSGKNTLSNQSTHSNHSTHSLNNPKSGNNTNFTASIPSPASNLDVCIKLHNKEIERRLIWRPELALGEGYMQGEITLERGSLYDLLDICTKNLSLGKYNPGLFQKLFSFITKFNNILEQYTPIGKARSNVAHHYDMQDDFSKLFLDQDRQYSCAYFKENTNGLERAQEDKKNHIARKLLLKPGQRVLDIGSGWGGMALHLAKLSDVKVDGLTLSVEQHKAATERAKHENLSDRVKFHLRDYREEIGKYDRIVSVGMFEHVGVPQYQTFFDQTAKLLTDDGIMLLHTIGASSPPRVTNPWIRKYIFPGGYCPSLSEIMPRIEKAKLVVTDIEILRYHYAETLRHWLQRFMKQRDQAKNMYDEKFCRMWEFYLASCEVGFRNQDLVVFQIQVARDKGRRIVPMTRDYLYDSTQGY